MFTFHVTWLDTFWTDLVHIYRYSHIDLGIEGRGQPYTQACGRFKDEVGDAGEDMRKFPSTLFAPRFILPIQVVLTFMDTFLGSLLKDRRTLDSFVIQHLTHKGLGIC